MKSFPEAVIQRVLLARLNKIPGCRVWRANAGVARADDRFVRFGRKGQADLTGILRFNDLGIRLEIEVKSATGKQSLEQKAFQQEIEAHGGIYLLARDIETTLEQILQITRSKNG